MLAQQQQHRRRHGPRPKRPRFHGPCVGGSGGSSTRGGVGRSPGGRSTGDRSGGRCRVLGVQGQSGSAAEAVRCERRCVRQAARALPAPGPPQPPPTLTPEQLGALPGVRRHQTHAARLRPRRRHLGLGSRLGPLSSGGGSVAAAAWPQSQSNVYSAGVLIATGCRCSGCVGARTAPRPTVPASPSVASASGHALERFKNTRPRGGRVGSRARRPAAAAAAASSQTARPREQNRRRRLCSRSPPPACLPGQPPQPASAPKGQLRSLQKAPAARLRTHAPSKVRKEQRSQSLEARGKVRSSLLRIEPGADITFQGFKVLV